MSLHVCPFCGSSACKIITDTLLHCSSCHIVFNSGYSQPSYSEDYFGIDYYKQYGVTYEEDFDSIYHSSLLRLRKIKTILYDNDLSSKCLLDVGCALGFFCKAALDFGFGYVEGIEISSFAASYCRDRFGIPVAVSSIEEFEPLKRYDVITAWYVIEHCVDPKAVLSKIYTMLQKDGVFACTLPSYFGPLYYFNMNQWIITHPIDHRFDVSPLGIRKILRNIGFSHIQCYPSGYHPERVGKIARKYKNIYKLLSDVLCFSDTLLLLAKK